MAIVIVSDIKNLQPWINALKKEDPSIEVTTMENISDKKVVKFALAWNYPHGLFLEYPEIKTISSMGAGVDHLISDPLLQENIRIVRIVDPLLSQDMYEFTLALIMNRLRKITYYHDNQKKGLWKKRKYLRIADVRIGIMGTGVIGNFIANKLQSSGFNVSGWGRTPGREASYKKYSGNDQLKEFLSVTDILICLLPLTSATEGILNKNNLLLLPEKSWVINLGRGGHIADNDLIELIDSGHLEGASLDVFRNEPLPEEHPFWLHQKILLTPHIASLPQPESVAPQIIENYHRTLENRPLINLVNRETGY
jgi:glyoxylate/hydroxypyruvate reductase